MRRWLAVLLKVSARRLLAEGLGTALLVAIVVGSGIAAAQRSDDGGIQLLVNALVTAAGLAVLIVVLHPISGAQLNPVVSVADWFQSSHRDRRPGSEVLAFCAAQVAGGAVGAMLANAMFAKPVVAFSHHHRAAGNILLGEVVATAGLVLVIVGLVRSGKASHLPWAVGAYIGAAYWFTSSTSFANPAVTIGRALTDTFSGIAPASIGGFLLAQLAGGAIGLALALALFDAETVTDDAAERPLTS